MQTDAYQLGYLDAALDFGLTKEAWAKAILPAAGAAMGAMLAPEGEGWQGAALGGLGALGVQSAALAGAKGIGNAFKRTPSPHAPTPGGSQMAQSANLKGLTPAQQDLNKMHRQEEMFGKTQDMLKREMASTDAELARNKASMGPHPLPPKPAVSPETAAASKHYGTDPALVTAMMNAPGPMKGAPQRHAPGPQMDADLQALHGGMSPPGALPPKSVPQQMNDELQAASNPPIPGTTKKAPKEKKEKEKGRKKKASLEDFKIAVDVSAGVSLPILGGASVGFKDQRERLPGMSRWVPRSTVERGFDYADEGVDPQAVAEQEADRGSLSHPLLGAALAAAGVAKFLPQSGPLGPLLGGLVGGGLGTLYNQATQGRRIEEGLEAHTGAQREREKFPIRRHGSQTANESTPLAVSRGHGDA
jgi:hypothetical protein